MTTTSSSAPVARVRSVLATVAALALALVAGATLVAPTAASQSAATVDPAEGPLYADGIVRFLTRPPTSWKAVDPSIPSSWSWT